MVHFKAGADVPLGVFVASSYFRVEGAVSAVLDSGDTAQHQRLAPFVSPIEHARATLREAQETDLICSAATCTPSCILYFLLKR